MRTMRSRPVVVGVNDTAESEDALRWAVGAAQRHERPLHVVATYLWSRPTTTDGLVDLGTPAPPRAIEDRFERALAYARDQLDVDAVTSELVSGTPARVLRRAADTADLLVVGTRGRALRHSVSRAVAAYATCPVVVVRPGAGDVRGRVVVGVDGSHEAEQAVAFAFEEASRRSATRYQSAKTR